MGQRDHPRPPRTSSGWSCGCRARWRTCPTPPARRRPTGCRARWRSPIAATSGPGRQPTARSATTCSWTPPRAAGTPPRPGGCRPGRCPRWRSCASTGPWRSTSTPATSTPGCWIQAATPSARPTRSPWTLTGCRPAPATAGCGQPLPPSSSSPGRVAAGRSWSRSWTSPTPASAAVRPSAVVLAARPSAAPWRAYPPERSGSCWWAWPQTPTCGWWRWIPAGPRGGASATGKRRSPPRRRPRSPCRAITRRQW